MLGRGLTIVGVEMGGCGIELIVNVLKSHSVVRRLGSALVLESKWKHQADYSCMVSDRFKRGPTIWSGIND